MQGGTTAYYPQFQGMYAVHAHTANGLATCMLILYSDRPGIIAALEERINRGLDVALYKRILRDFRRLNPEPM